MTNHPNLVRVLGFFIAERGTMPALAPSVPPSPAHTPTRMSPVPSDAGDSRGRRLAKSKSLSPPPEKATRMSTYGRSTPPPLDNSLPMPAMRAHKITKTRSMPLPDAVDGRTPLRLDLPVPEKRNPSDNLLEEIRIDGAETPPGGSMLCRRGRELSRSPAPSNRNSQSDVSPPTPNRSPAGTVPSGKYRRFLGFGEGGGKVNFNVKGPGRGASRFGSLRKDSRDERRSTNVRSTTQESSGKALASTNSNRSLAISDTQQGGGDLVIVMELCGKGSLYEYMFHGLLFAVLEAPQHLDASPEATATNAPSEARGPSSEKKSSLETKMSVPSSGPGSGASWGAKTRSPIISLSSSAGSGVGKAGAVNDGDLSRPGTPPGPAPAGSSTADSPSLRPSRFQELPVTVRAQNIEHQATKYYYVFEDEFFKLTNASHGTNERMNELFVLLTRYTWFNFGRLILLRRTRTRFRPKCCAARSPRR